MNIKQKLLRKIILAADPRAFDQGTLLDDLQQHEARLAARIQDNDSRHAVHTPTAKERVRPPVWKNKELLTLAASFLVLILTIGFPSLVMVGVFAVWGAIAGPVCYQVGISHSNHPPEAIFVGFTCLLGSAIAPIFLVGVFSGDSAGYLEFSSCIFFGLIAYGCAFTQDVSFKPIQSRRSES